MDLNQSLVTMNLTRKASELFTAADACQPWAFLFQNAGVSWVVVMRRDTPGGSVGLFDTMIGGKPHARLNASSQAQHRHLARVKKKKIY